MQITKVLNFLFSDAKIKLDSLSSDQRKIITINGWIKDELIRIVEMKNATLNKNLITKHIGSGGYLSLSLFFLFSFFFFPYSKRFIRDTLAALCSTGVFRFALYTGTALYYRYRHHRGAVSTSKHAMYVALLFYSRRFKPCCYTVNFRRDISKTIIPQRCNCNAAIKNDFISAL